MNEIYLQIKEKLDTLSIEELAYQTGFQKRIPKKLNALDFTTGVFKSLHEGELTPNRIAKEIGIGQQNIVSRKAVDNKLSYRHEPFAKAIFEEALSKKLTEKRDNSLFDFFLDAFLYDSSCLKVPENLFEIFPGPHSSKGKCATVRLQLRMNLLNSTYTHIDIQSYRDNDQKYSAEIAKQTQAGELNIFDLGYAVLGSLEAIDKKLAYFLCRLRFGVKVFTKDGRPINLLKELQRLYRRGICHLDWEVRIGEKKRLPVRVIAQKVPQRVYEQRLKKAKNDRDQRTKHSDEYYQMLAWTILITNVPKEVWTPAQALRAYQFRWRIEVIFKCWKSKFHLQAVFKARNWIRPPAAKMYLYFILTWLLLFFVPLFKYYEYQVWNTHQKELSILKFADCVNEHLSALLKPESNPLIINHVAYHSCYDKRKDRLNYLELLNMF